MLPGKTEISGSSDNSQEDGCWEVNSTSGRGWGGWLNSWKTKALQLVSLLLNRLGKADATRCSQCTDVLLCRSAGTFQRACIYLTKPEGLLKKCDDTRLFLKTTLPVLITCHLMGEGTGTTTHRSVLTWSSQGLWKDSTYLGRKKKEGPGPWKSIIKQETRSQTPLWACSWRDFREEKPSSDPASFQQLQVQAELADFVEKGGLEGTEPWKPKSHGRTRRQRGFPRGCDPSPNLG